MKLAVCRVVFGMVMVLTAMRTVEAAVILDTDYAWTDTESTLSTRIFRDGDGTTWANFPEPFEGTIGSGAYRYTTFNVSVGDANFLRVTLDNPVTTARYNAMIAGYQGSFTPTNLSLNWLGDPGLSTGGPVVPISFEVIAPQHSTFVVLLFQIDSSNSLFAGSISHVRVDGFMDANETEPPAAVPEPATLSLLTAGLLGAVGMRRRRRIYNSCR
jgi:hypothetical protein